MTEKPPTDAGHLTPRRVIILGTASHRACDGTPRAVRREHALSARDASPRTGEPAELREA